MLTAVANFSTCFVHMECLAKERTRSYIMMDPAQMKAQIVCKYNFYLHHLVHESHTNGKKSVGSDCDTCYCIYYLVGCLYFY
ncbi:hypothetical protein Peur_011210 [Populus x canadensis]